MCDTEGAEVGAEHGERDVPIGVEAPSSDEGADVAAVCTCHRLAHRL